MTPLDPTPLLRETAAVPVLSIERLDEAVPLARALVSGGLRLLEVTLRTPVALDAVRAIVDQVPDAVVGIGTITRAADLDRSLDAGARFLVSPGTPQTLARALAEAPVPVLPGCATVSEAMLLRDFGFRVLKFFPAEASGGVAWLKAVAGPLAGLRFCPTGGIDPRNAAAYLALENVLAVGGSWMAPTEAVERGDFSRVAALAREAASLRIDSPRGA